MTVHANVASRPALPPGPPPPRTAFGRVAFLARMLSDPVGTVGGRFARYGDLYHVPDAGGGLYVVRHPDHIHEVLVTQASRYEKTHSALERLRLVLGEGLLTSDGEHWKRHRRMVQPAFARPRLEGYATAMVDEAERVAERLSDEAGRSGGAPVDVSREMMQLTLRVVARTLFSHDVTGETSTVASAMAALQDALLTFGVVPDWLPTPGRIRARRAVEALDEIVYTLVRDRRSGASRAPDPPDLLQMLVTAVDAEGDGRRMDEKEVRDELITLFLAGHETTSQALSWTFHLLAGAPEAEARLHAEVDAVLGAAGSAGARRATHDDVTRLPWTTQVIKEAMRLYPPAYMVARRAREATSIGGYPVPAGAEVVVWILHTHRDPRFYPDPMAFRPERFAPESEASRPRLAYLPFGAGPRACIGRHFAMIEAVLLLATLARRVRFERIEGVRVKARTRVTLSPKGGLPMHARART